MTSPHGRALPGELARCACAVRCPLRGGLGRADPGRGRRGRVVRERAALGRTAAGRRLGVPAVLLGGVAGAAARGSGELLGAVEPERRGVEREVVRARGGGRELGDLSRSERLPRTLVLPRGGQRAPGLLW